jgi:hypothetical protein
VNYTSALERDVARPRAENRALLNSILGIAGVPPIVVTADDQGALAPVSSGVEKAAPGLRAGLEIERGGGRIGNGAKRVCGERECNAETVFERAGTEERGYADAAEIVASDLPDAGD